jgi:IS5 family transposase
MKADELLAHAPGRAFIADAGYDSNRFRQAIRDRKKRAVIGSKPERPRKLPKPRAVAISRGSALRRSEDLRANGALLDGPDRSALRGEHGDAHDLPGGHDVHA